ncbi:MAG TPA: MMPL family transporter [Gaiellaceae bacterium]|nr:MMPL family transporter [Gaiellaceae bacterium]
MGWGAPRSQPRASGPGADLIAELIAGRRSKWVVAVVAVLVAGALSSVAGKVELTSDPAVLLPDGAESVEALRAIERFPSGDVTPAVVVVSREAGLTGEDRDRVDELRSQIDADGLPGATPTTPPQVSEDGTAAVLVTLFRNVEEEPLLDAVDTLRERTSALEGDGLEVHVTGGAGFAADVQGVFSGINGVILLGAATIVLVLLVLVYGSPIFWLVPFFTVLMSEGASRGTQYLFGEAGFSITGQAAGVASVLVFGAATDYALLLVARYRDELRVHEDTHEAMRVALRGAAPAILASGMTVVLGLLTLLLARVGSNQALGPLAAAGVFLAMVFSLTLLPATLLIVGRRAFWPRVPRPGGQVREPLESAWGRLGARVRRRPRRVWVAGIAVLALLALGLTRMDLGVAQAEQFPGEVEAVAGAEILAEAGFAEGGGAPLRVVVPQADRARDVAGTLGELDGVARVGEPERGEPGALLDVALRADPYGQEALEQVPDVRRAGKAAGGDDVLVGGSLAEDYDTREASERDNVVVMPVVIVVVLLILVALLRAVVLPLLLIATVVVSFGSALGVAVLVSNGLDFAGIETTVPLLAFVFLVALGVDYNIFLVARAREEAARHGTAEGMHRALAATGAVITSAGLVLAGTFSILTLIPFVGLIQLGVVITFGVLLDTLLVRSVIVPALVWDAGGRVWWPGRPPGPAGS